MEFFSRGDLNTPKLSDVLVTMEGRTEWMGDLNSTVRHLYKEMDGFHSLQQLKLSEFPELKIIWLGNHPATLFSSLKLLEISECDFPSYAISSRMLLSLNNLEELRVTKCYSIEETFDGSEPEESRNNNVLSKLGKFSLHDLPNLRHVWPENLEEILGFKNLRWLDICDCNSLRYILTPSMVLCLVQLRKMVVKNCACVEEIILKEDGMRDDSALIIFPKLNTLLLQSLPCMVNFYSGNGVLEFSCLETLTINDCPKLETFTSTEGNGEEFDNKPLFNDKVAIPNLEELTLENNMDGLKSIWGNEFHSNSFSKLKMLKIEDGSALLNVFPHSMLRSGLLNLQNLVVSRCNSLEELFDVQMLLNKREEHVVLTPTQLTSITISQLPKLMHVWNKDPDGLLSFQNLQRVSATLCPTLKSLFPVSVALTLELLEELTIRNCRGMEEIVSKEEGDQEQSCAPRFVFPKVAILRLRKLEALKRFYPGPYSSDWPKLLKLSVYDCQNFDIFSPKLEIIQDGACREEESDIEIHRLPFLSFTQIIPNLEELSLRGENFDMIHDQDLFTANKLECLDLQCFHDGSQVFPVSFLQKFPNLKKLVVSLYHFKQPFTDEMVADETNAKSLARILDLKLDQLHEMTHIWNGNSQLDDVLHDLQILTVWRCSQLISLAPSTTLFENLTSLKVRKCNGLLALLGFSSAKSLVQLKSMSIRECNSLVQIVANDEDEGQMEDIVYEKLEKITLRSLTSLHSFCSANCNFKFPSLVSVITEECPNMEFFSGGVLDTPKLSKVWVTMEGRAEWMGDLNSTVRLMYKETNSS